jgi:hypothetical protein
MLHQGRGAASTRIALTHGRLRRAGSIADTSSVLLIVDDFREQ